MKKGFYITCLLCFTLPLCLFSQNTVKELRYKKIGLVLSGGGAKGMAHIGILEALDSLHLKVSYIGGTSMGSIVSSLYACGYSGKEIEWRLKKMIWSDLFNDEIALNRVSIEEKQDHQRFLVDIPIRKGKISLRSGIIRGPNLYNELVKLTFPMIDKYNFDSLPIPLRINAVDLETGENVVFKKGFLPAAMRASMSIPSVFYPVEMDSGYYVDGGVMRNTLIPEIKAMNPDYIIVSFTGNKLTNKAELSSIASILEHVFFITGSRDFGEHEKEADLFIQPELTSKDASGFKRSSDIIDAGIKATLQKFKDIETLSLDTLFQKSTSSNKFHDDAKILNEVFVLENILYNKLDKEGQRFFEATSGLEKQKDMCLREFFHHINKAYSSLRYDYIYYEMVFKGYTPDGKKRIDLKFHVTEAAKINIRLGLHYDTDLGSGFMVNAIMRDLLLKRSRFVIEADVAQSPRAKISYMVFIDKKYRLQLGTLNQFEQDRFETYSEHITTESYRTNIFKSYNYLQWKVSGNLALNAGYENEFMRISPKVSSDSLFLLTRSFNITNHAFLTYLQYNTLNRPAIPTRGLRFQIQYRYIFNSKTVWKIQPEYVSVLNNNKFILPYDNYGKLRAFMEGYLPITNRITYCLNMDGGIALNDIVNPFDFYFLGSVEKGGSRTATLLGYRNSEIQALNFISGNTGLQFNLFNAFFLKTSVGAAALTNGPYKLLYTDFNKNNNQVIKTSGFGLTASYLIPKFGPISFTVHKSFDRSLWLFYFTLGYKFPLF